MTPEVQTSIIGATGIVLSAGVSAAAVILTQRLADKRHAFLRERELSADEERRKDERAHLELEYSRTREQRQDESRRSLDERWRDERRDAHAQLLAAVNSGEQLARMYYFRHLWILGDDEDGVSGLEKPTPVLEDGLLSGQEKHEMTDALSIIELIGSTVAVEHAKTAVNTLLWMDANVSKHSQTPAKSVIERYEQIRPAIRSYRAAVRIELGVSDDGAAVTPAPSS